MILLANSYLAGAFGFAVGALVSVMSVQPYAGDAVRGLSARRALGTALAAVAE